VSSARSDTTNLPVISREELVRALRDRRVTLVDVLSPESFAGMHIPGAINLPVADIARDAARVLPDRDAPVVTYCGGPT
jgi:rhodanese-related sulfurtransferase